MRFHKSITQARIIAAVEESNFGLSMPGSCTACGADADAVEPDAELYPCEVCYQPGVYGAEQLLIMGAFS